MKWNNKGSGGPGLGAGLKMLQYVVLSFAVAVFCRLKCGDAVRALA
jgi:hypothetical protein